MHEVIKEIKLIGRILLGWPDASRGLTVYPDDVFLVSYPRSGNTWARFLIGNLAYQHEQITFANIESRIPEINLFPDWVLRRVPRPRILKSHSFFRPVFPRVIYIVRDPRDVAISYYHYGVKLGRVPESYSLNDYIPRFVTAEMLLDVAGGSWAEHVASWLATRRGRSNFLLLRYEDILKDPMQELSKIARFLNIEATPQQLARAVELSSADRMRSLEKKQSRQWRGTKKTRQDKSFIRGAAAGGWKSVLSENSVAEIESAWSREMQILGYELSTDPVTASTPIGLDSFVPSDRAKV